VDTKYLIIIFMKKHIKAIALYSLIVI
jgi:hypothetical protein